MCSLTSSLTAEGRCLNSCWKRWVISEAALVELNGIEREAGER